MIQQSHSWASIPTKLSLRKIQVGVPIMAQQGKDPVLPQWWHGFNPWQGHFHMLCLWQRRGRRKRGRRGRKKRRRRILCSPSKLIQNVRVIWRQKNNFIKKGVPVMAQWLTNPTRNHKVAGLILGLAQWVKDLELWWLWCRLVAVAPV